MRKARKNRRRDADRVRADARRMFDQIERQVTQAAKQARTDWRALVRKWPRLSLGTAIFSGAVLGGILRGGGRRRQSDAKKEGLSVMPSAGTEDKVLSVTNAAPVNLGERVRESPERTDLRDIETTQDGDAPSSAATVPAGAAYTG